MNAKQKRNYIHLRNFGKKLQQKASFIIEAFDSNNNKTINNCLVARLGGNYLASKIGNEKAEAILLNFRKNSVFYK